MNIEIQNIRKRIPTDKRSNEIKRLNNEKIIKLYYNLLNRTGVFWYGEKYGHEEIIKAMEEVLCIILGCLADMDIFMDNFMDILIKNNFNINERGQNHFNFYSYIRKELDLLKNKEDMHHDIDINETYERLEAVLSEKKGFHQDESLLDSNSFLQKYAALITQEALNLLNSDDIIEDIDYFSSLVFSVFTFFVEIGYNPYKDIHTMLHGKQKGLIKKQYV